MIDQLDDTESNPIALTSSNREHVCDADVSGSAPLDAIEYGSSPDEHPADQIRTFLICFLASSSGMISSTRAASCAGSRKK